MAILSLTSFPEKTASDRVREIFTYVTLRLRNEQFRSRPFLFSIGLHLLFVLLLGLISRTPSHDDTIASPRRRVVVLVDPVLAALRPVRPPQPRNVRTQAVKSTPRPFKAPPSERKLAADLADSPPPPQIAPPAAEPILRGIPQGLSMLAATAPSTVVLAAPILGSNVAEQNHTDFHPVSHSLEVFRLGGGRSGVSDGGPERADGVTPVRNILPTVADAEVGEVRPAPSFRPVDVPAMPRPEYTAEARALRIQGFVLVRVLFRASGSIEVLDVQHPLRHGLDEEAVATVKLLKFKPATQDGNPVDSVATLKVVFELAN